MEALQHTLAQLENCWIGGGSAQPLAPKAWQTLIASDTEQQAERRLLAFAGQSAQTCLCPQPPETLTLIPTFIPQAMPRLNDVLRAMFCRALNANPNPNIGIALVTLVTLRGYSVCPQDIKDLINHRQMPEQYASWKDWQEGLPHTTQALDLDNWSEFGKAARLDQLKRIRRQDHAKFSALMREKGVKEQAPQRLEFLQIIAANLVADDLELLRVFEQGRSGLVHDLTKQLLSRLGQAPTGNTSERLLISDFIKLKTKGIIRKKPIFTLDCANKKARTNALQALKSATVQELEKDLNLSVAEFISLWPWGEHAQFDTEFADLIGRSGSAQVVEHFCTYLHDNNHFKHLRIGSFFQNLTPEQQRLVILQSKYSQDIYNALYENCLPFIGQWTYDALKKTRLIDELLKKIKTQEYETEAFHIELLCLGLLANQQAAQTLMELLQTHDLQPSAKAMAVLRMSAQLKPAND